MVGLLGNERENSTPNRCEQETVRDAACGHGDRAPRRESPSRRRVGIGSSVQQQLPYLLHGLRRTVAATGRRGDRVSALLKRPQVRDGSLPLACPARPPIHTAVGWERVECGATGDPSLRRGSTRHHHTPSTANERFLYCVGAFESREKIIFG